MPNYDELARKHGATGSNFDALAVKHGAMEPQGGGLPPLPPAPIPLALRNPTNAPAGYGISGRDRFGRQYTEKDVTARVPIVDAPITGAQQMYQGAAALTDPSLERKAHGTSQMVRGAMGVLTPVLPGVALAAPGPVAAGLISGSLASNATERGLKAAGVPAGYAELTGDVAGIGVGGTVAKGVSSEGFANVRNSASDSLRAAAERTYAQALRPTKAKLKKLTEEKIAPGAVERGITANTMKGLREKADAGLERAGREYATVSERVSTKENPPVDVAPILERLDNLRAKAVVNGVEVNPAKAKAIDEFRELVTTLAEKDPAGGPTQVSFASLNKARQVLDETLGDKHIVTSADAPRAGIMRETSNAMRHELAKASPDMAKVNAEYSFWKGFSRVVGETAERTQSQRPGLGEMIASGAGFAGELARGGGIGRAAAAAAITGMIARTLKSTAWKTRSAVFKSKLADAIATEDGAGTMKLLGELPQFKGKGKFALAGIKKVAEHVAGTEDEGVLQILAESNPADHLDVLARASAVKPGTKAMQILVDRLANQLPKPAED